VAAAVVVKTSVAAAAAVSGRMERHWSGTNATQDQSSYPWGKAQYRQTDWGKRYHQR
jgi:hypothetical protein